ncbi:uncharacterized protein A1O5_00305 [Cladophialophora psammophila CBS 110553]|uniref:Uncharacterized protein n=1 Tax=Cladophialophora psammophila CBS 110553 TaxID=1182543 RepID=W9X6E4_9EURO|nr:uncharacterized protein A1O5_00305 [Cladophialophora psammophila CBS 110553]EXJ75798.1 hypothetical protein A1O5_00305 [Cladophialophora psammophila CBS 110553]
MVLDILPFLDAIGNNDNQVGTEGFENPHICFLRWYHSHSVNRIIHKLQENPNNRTSTSRVDCSKHKDWAEHWQVRAERALRLFGQGRLINQHLSHDVANLALVGKEIQIEKRALGLQGKSCLQYAQDLIKRRQVKKELNPGEALVRRWDAIHNHAIRSSMPRPAPWESNCLEHHVPVNLEVALSVEECMEACKEFLLSDYTFAADFDASNPETVAQWWDMKTSSIISWKILDGLMSENNATKATFSQLVKAERKVVDKPSKIEETIQALTECIRQRLPPAEDMVGYSWRKRRPNLLYHADAAVQSLEDTPQVYDQKQKSVTVRTHIGKYFKDSAFNLDFGMVKKYFQRQGVDICSGDMTQFFGKTMPSVHPAALQKFFDKISRPISKEMLERFFEKSGMAVHHLWTLDNIKQIIPPEKLGHLSCFDFTLKADGGDAPEIGVTVGVGRANLVDKKPWIGLDEEVKKDPKDKMSKQEESALLTLYFLDRHKLYPGYDAFPKPFRQFLEHTCIRKKWLESYQKEVFAVLNDSLVDLGTKYRLLQVSMHIVQTDNANKNTRFVRRICPEIILAMIFMWHTDALDAIDDNLGVLSHFVDTENQLPTGEGVMWTTSVTISLWRLQDDLESKICDVEDDFERDEKKLRLNYDREESEKHSLMTRMRFWDSFPAFGTRGGGNKSANEEAPLARITTFPPKSVSDQRNKVDNRLSTIRELSISLVISGDRMGRFWICSVISELFDEAEVKEYRNEIKDILQMFIHQQYTGRVLAFLLLLGHMCESLSKECDKFADQMDHIMGMNPLVLLKGLEWRKSDAALKKLKQMLWGFEALRIFDEKLERALDEINQAKEKMESELKRGRDIRHKDMKRNVERVVEDFEKRRKRLENLHNVIKQRIDQVAKLREGISSVRGVEQNENISMLTWVTITYLPLGFVAGVFSMGHGIVPDSAGWGTFMWALAVFLVATLIFVKSLQLIKRGFRIVWPRQNTLPGHVAEASRTASNLFQIKNLRRRGGTKQSDVEQGSGLSPTWV